MIVAVAGQLPDSWLESQYQVVRGSERPVCRQSSTPPAHMFKYAWLQRSEREISRYASLSGIKAPAAIN